MAIQHRAILDQIQQVKDQFNLGPGKYTHVQIEREVVLGMKFRKGQDVTDKRTGQSGKVIAGYRRAVPKVPVPGDGGA